MPDNNTILTRFFTQRTIKSLIMSDEESSIFYKVVRRYHIPYGANTSNAEVISEIYQYLAGSYRNEYLYKNTLLNKLLINAHRINTTVALTEVPIANSKADFIMINGKAVVYEIKTELDTFERLENQIKDYYKAFDHVCVVTSETQESALLEKLSGTPTGLYILTKKNTIRKPKEPEEYREKLDINVMFKILNKPEYESLTAALCGFLPNVKPVKYYRECMRLVSGFSVEEVYPLFLKELKKRSRVEVIDFSRIPNALNCLAYFSRYSSEDYKKLLAFLNGTYREDQYVLSDT